MVRVNLQKKEKAEASKNSEDKPVEESKGEEENEVIEEAPVSLDDNLTEEIFNEFLSQLSEKFEGIEVNANLLPVILKEAMEVAESSKLEGHLKKLLVNKLINQLVDNSAMSEEQKETCQKLLSSGFLDETMDVLVEVSRGNFDVNDLKYRGVNCLIKFFKIMWEKLCLKWQVRQAKRNEKKQAKQEAREKAMKEREEKKQKEEEAKKKRAAKVRVKVLTAQSVLRQKQEAAAKKAKSEGEEKAKEDK